MPKFNKIICSFGINLPLLLVPGPGHRNRAVDLPRYESPLRWSGVDQYLKPSFARALVHVLRDDRETSLAC